jgi:hypothetical protein
MVDFVSWGGLAVAVGSLIVSIIAFKKSTHAQDEANAVQKRLVEIEEQREQERQLSIRQASLRPELREVSNNSYRLYLINEGSAVANNVRVLLDGNPINEHAARSYEEPPNLVGPNSEVSVLLSISFDCVPPFGIEVRWDDASGSDRSYIGTLTF